MKYDIEEGFFPIKSLPNGEFFKLKPNSSRIYIKGGYDRSEKRYKCTAFDDISCSRMMKGEKLVYVGFTF